MSELAEEKLNAIEAKARIDFDRAVPDASRFGSAGAGVIAQHAPEYVREVARVLIEEGDEFKRARDFYQGELQLALDNVTRLTRQRDELREAADEYSLVVESWLPPATFGKRPRALERLTKALEAAR